MKRHGEMMAKEISHRNEKLMDQRIENENENNNGKISK
jgi:hypothetical protein